MSTLYKNIGAKVKMLREKNRLTQEEVADKLGYKSKVTVSLIEKGQYTINAATLKKYSEIFQIPIKDLVEDEADPVNSKILAQVLRSDPDLNEDQIQKILKFIEFIKQE